MNAKLFLHSLHKWCQSNKLLKQEGIRYGGKVRFLTTLIQAIFTRDVCPAFYKAGAYSLAVTLNRILNYGERFMCSTQLPFMGREQEERQRTIRRVNVTPSVIVCARK